MKKSLLLLLVVSIMLTACGQSNEKNASTVDSTKVAKDTVKAKVDTIKVKSDSLIKK